MDESKVAKARSESLRRIAEAVKPNDRTVTPELQQGEVEALLLMAATTFMAQHRVHYDRSLVHQIADAAMEGMGRFLDSRGAN